MRPITAAIALVGVGVGSFLAGSATPCLPRAAASNGARADAITVGADGVPRVSVDLAHLADDTLRSRLESGLAQTLVTRVDGYGASDVTRPLATARSSCRVRYDEWDERYEARVEAAGSTTIHRTSSLDEVLDVCLDLRALEVGAPSDWADDAADGASFVATVELNPLSRESAHRVHLWLEQGNDGSDTVFFGPFVGLFVDGQIGDAERALGAQEPAPSDAP